MGNAVETVRDAVPTSRHARMLFSMVADRLGDAAYVESFNEETQLALFTRKENDYVPWPRLRVDLRGRMSHVKTIVGPAEPPPPKGRKRNLRNLGPGEVVVHDGPESITVTYGDDGRCVEASESRNPLPAVASAMSGGAGGPTERLAEFVAALDHGPAVVHMPVPLPGILRGVWATGRRAIRHALFHDKVPHDARWVAADGYDGAALAWGATRDEALTRWREEVERLRPAPREKAKPVDPPPGAFPLKVARADGERPEPAPENTPAAVVRLDPPPAGPCPFGAWTRVLGDYGEVVSAARRGDVAGFTMIGEPLMEKLGKDGLERLDEILAQAPPQRDQWSREYNSVTTFFEVAGDPPAARPCEGSHGDAFDPDRLRAELVRQWVVRQRWRDLE